MEPEQYAVMARREERHWWYAGMRETALAVLRGAITGQRGLRILDAGCGTGGTTIQLEEFGRVFGVDLAWEALLPARERGLGGRLGRASVEHLPFADGSFDLVTSFEVIYHLGVGSDLVAFAELHRVLRNDGLLLLRLPGHDWLRGEHDRLVHTRHRYTCHEVSEKLRAVGFELELLSWANSALFPPAALKRLLEPYAARRRGETEDGAPEPDLWQPPEPLNGLLTRLLSVEGSILPRGITLPFGLSVIALARAS